MWLTVCITFACCCVLYVSGCMDIYMQYHTHIHTHTDVIAKLVVSYPLHCLCLAGNKKVSRDLVSGNVMQKAVYSIPRVCTE